MSSDGEGERRVMGPPVDSGIRFEERPVPAWQYYGELIVQFKGLLFCAAVLFFLWRRNRSKNTRGTPRASTITAAPRAPARGVDVEERASERVMVHEVRRSKLVEQMQQEYEQRAKEAEEKKREKARLEAEERARKLAESTSAPDAAPASLKPKPEYNPLVGGGGSSGFKSDRCTRRGG